MTVRQYLKLLDWTGRQARGGKGQIPEQLAPLLKTTQRLVKRPAHCVTVSLPHPLRPLFSVKA